MARSERPATDRGAFVLGSRRASFPIAGPKAVDTKRTRHLDAELPDLIHPLDPREPHLGLIIGFDGIEAESIAASGSREERRANAMIDLFRINKRDDLRRERVEVIQDIYLARVADPTSEDALQVAQSVITRTIDQFAKHSNCARCYLKLWETDPEKAAQLGIEACGLLAP